MEQFKCANCDRLFKSSAALRGHSRVHIGGSAYKAPKIDRRITCGKTGKRVLPEHLASHQANLRVCQNGNCAKYFIKKTAQGLYCSQSCAAVVNNTGRVVSEEQRSRVSKSLRGVPRPHALSRVYFKQCPSCQAGFCARADRRKFCSVECASEGNSIAMIEKIMSNSSGNFSTKIGDYCYKGISVSCDSKLEAAGVQYLVDHLGAISIERCSSIINYRDPEGKNHRFNPDFYVRTATDRFIVEVKQVWRHSPTVNKYNRYFTEKREAMENFAISKNLKTIWLDFDYDPRLLPIYRNILKTLHR